MFYKILNLPVVPEHYEGLIRSAVLDSKNFIKKEHNTQHGYAQYQERQIKKSNGDTVQSVLANRYQLNQEVHQWLLANIHPCPTKQNISYYNAVSDTMGPHVDTGRNEVWLYVIDPGGDNVETVWYQESGHPICRPDMQQTDSCYTNAARCDYANLIELERFKIPKHTWVAIDALVIHSVEGLTSNRLTIQVTP
jgi:hypothetical protein